MRAQASGERHRGQRRRRGPIQGIGRKQIPRRIALAASTTAATWRPKIQNKPATETATKTGFFQRKGAR